MQTFLYCLLYIYDTGSNAVVPEVLKVRDLFKGDFSTQLKDKDRSLPVEDFGDYKEEFTKKLTAVIDEIFDSQVPFDQCTEVKLCQWCAFKVICRR